MEVQMTARRTAIVSILFITASLSFATQTYAKWTEVHGDTTMECESVKKTKCTIHPNGTQTCKQIDSVKCVAIKGPGSGKPALTNDWDTPPSPQPMRTFNLNSNAMLATFG
jgi:hypothetical protein